jgi:hypothetical protein
VPVDLGDPRRQAPRRPVALELDRRAARELPDLLISLPPGLGPEDVSDGEGAEGCQPHDPSVRRLIADVTALAAERTTIVAPAATPDRTRLD